MSQFWSPIVDKLTPYVPGEQPKINNLIKLNTNENPYPPSDKVMAAIADATNENLKRYPDPNSTELVEAIAEYYHLDTQQVFVGNGSDEVLAHTFQALLQHDKPLLYPDISYSFYPVYCDLFQINAVQVPLNEDFEIDINDYQQDNSAIIFPNPNAPTGRELPLEKIRQLADIHKNSLIVVDEAYIDFGGESAVALVNDFNNILVIQTFSKSRALAGLRIGFAMGHPDLIDALNRVKNSFNSYPLDQIAIKAGCAAIKDESYFQQRCEQVINTRDYLSNMLSTLGFSVLPSAANFVFAKHASLNAEDISLKLREKGIIVRHFGSERIQQHLRISIGTDEEIQKLLEELEVICQA